MGTWLNSFKVSKFICIDSNLSYTGNDMYMLQIIKSSQKLESVVSQSKFGRLNPSQVAQQG